MKVDHGHRRHDHGYYNHAAMKRVSANRSTPTNKLALSN